MQEIWIDIEGYEGMYQVSNMGRVKSLERKVYISSKNVYGTKKPKILKSYLDGYGYPTVKLFKDGKKKNYHIHRLVAAAFIPNPENKPTVDHINAIKTDNRVDNLRWFTYSEQINENENTRNNLLESRRKSKGRSKKVMCITTGKVFDSAKEGGEYYGCNLGKNMCAIASGRQKTCGKLPDGTKLEWEYIDE